MNFAILNLMKGTILVTDNLFIFPEHEAKLREAGYEIERLDKPEATEEELIEAVKGKVGYILGGIWIHFGYRSSKTPIKSTSQSLGVP